MDKGEEIKGHGLEEGHSREAQCGCRCGRHLEGTYKQTLSMTVSALQSCRFLFLITSLFIFYFNFLPVRYESPRCFGANLSAFDLLSEARFSSSRGTCSLLAIYCLE